MEHLLLKAATTATTDQGIFEAVISASSVDREKDVVNPDGMVNALQKWTETGKRIPLAWNHSTKAEDIIGYVEPESAKNVNGEVVVSGFIDQSTPRGTEAWRLVKSGTLGFSFGYLILKGSNRKGGGRNIDELDVFEVTATPTPMHNSTRVLGFKSTDDLLEHAEEVVREAEEETKHVRPEYATLRITHEEMDGLAAGDLKAVWSAAFIDNLPDSAFLYVEPGGEKDQDGKTVPRSLRHFPYKDSSGAVDVPHVRNALARIPDSDIPQGVKDRLTAKAQQILYDAQKSIPEGHAASSGRLDPLLEKADALVLELASDGESLRKPPNVKVAPKPMPQLSPDELRVKTRDAMLAVLTGVDDT